MDGAVKLGKSYNLIKNEVENLQMNSMVDSSYKESNRTSSGVLYHLQLERTRKIRRT